MGAQEKSYIGAMAIFTNILLSLLFFSSVFSDAKVSGTNTDSHHAVRLQALLALDRREACLSKEYGGSGLKIVDRHGPCSPFSGPKASPLQILQQDQSRVNWLQSQLKEPSSQFNTDAAAALPSRLGSSLGSANYIVTVGFGTPKKDTTIALDTGSSLTWIQCQPCAGGCYPQQDPIFDPADSSSYLNSSCDSADCTQAGLSTGCFSSTCTYRVNYSDESTTAGFLARDTLTLSPSDAFPNFQFGCSQQTKGLFGRTTGLLGLGRGEISLVSQTATKFGEVFSYCLPQPSSTGYLKFGAEAISSGARFTPLLTRQERPSLYFVDMVGITVGGDALPIPPSVFASPGTIIDSGTVITRLPPSADAALRSAFRLAMSNYRLAPPVSLYDTCYNLNGMNGTIKIPKITLHFEGGVDVDVVASGILEAVSEHVACLAFIGNDDANKLGIIGSRQQRTFDVVYVAGGRLGFSPGGC